MVKMLYVMSSDQMCFLVFLENGEVFPTTVYTWYEWWSRTELGVHSSKERSDGEELFV